MEEARTEMQIRALERKASQTLELRRGTAESRSSAQRRKSVLGESTKAVCAPSEDLGSERHEAAHLVHSECVVGAWSAWSVLA